jgi:hypothetical protein
MRFWVEILTQAPAVVTEVFNAFPQYFLENSLSGG